MIGSARGVVGMNGDELVLIVGCLVRFPVVNKETVLRDEPLDHLLASSETKKSGRRGISTACIICSASGF